jgi:peptidoglycan/LPS O-acetylase OafA/YrhL
MISSPLRRNQGLDLLRGVAILLVLFNHIDPHTIPDLVEPRGLVGAIYWRIKGLGWTGVDMFFVLSGFLISGLLLKEIENAGTLQAGRFWFRRAFKILPSYLFFLAIMAATQATAWLDTTSWTSIGNSLASHLLFAQNYLQSNPNGPTWSLAVEEHFYILLPCLLLLLSKGVASHREFENRLLITGALIITALPAFRCLHAIWPGVGQEDYRYSHFRADSLIFGVLTQLMLRRREAVVLRICEHPLKTLFAAGLLILPGMFLGRVSPFMFAFGYSMLAFGYSMVLLVFVSKMENAATSLAGKALAATGRWSYNIYLWNFYLLLLPIPGYRAAHDWINAHVPGTVPALLAHAVVFMSTAIIIGGVITQVIEAPFLKLRDRFSSPKPKSREAQAPAEAGLAATMPAA